MDFLVKEGKQVKELIQVCYSIEDSKARKREMTALKTANKELALNTPVKNTLLTMDKNDTVEIDGITVIVRNIIDWLLLPES